MQELKRDPAQSDRSIAKKANMSHHTVAKVRAQQEDGGQFAHHEVRIGADGVAQPAVKKRRGIRPGAKPRDERIAEIKALAAEGNNVVQIAAAIGVTEQGSRRDSHRQRARVIPPRWVGIERLPSSEQRRYLDGR